MKTTAKQAKKKLRPTAKSRPRLNEARKLIPPLCFYADDNSHYPLIRVGDYLVFNTDLKPQSGDFVLCKLPDEQRRIIRQYIREGDRIILHNVNPRFYDYLVKDEIPLTVNGILTAVQSAKDLENRNWESLVDAGIMIDPSLLSASAEARVFSARRRRSKKGAA